MSHDLIDGSAHVRGVMFTSQTGIRGDQRCAFLSFARIPSTRQPAAAAGRARRRVPEVADDITAIPHEPEVSDSAPGAGVSLPVFVNGLPFSSTYVTR